MAFAGSYVNVVKRKKGKSKSKTVTPEQLMKLVNETDGKDRLMVVCFGLLGMRESELQHMTPDWIHIGDYEAKVNGGDHVRIPDDIIDCNCPKCEWRAYRKYLQDNDVDENNKRKHHPYSWYMKKQKEFYAIKPVKSKRKKCMTRFYGNLNHLQGFWKPKTKAGARRIPISLSIIKEVLQEHYEPNTDTRIDMSPIHMWDRVSDVGYAILGKQIFPHSLRATYASILGKTNVITASSLKKLLGWANLSTADSYVESDMIEAMRAANTVLPEIMKSSKSVI